MPGGREGPRVLGWVSRSRAAAVRFLPMIKSPQTVLLLVTGLAGFSSARCPVVHWTTLLGLAGSLFLAISGGTVLNMWHDRDIDLIMPRTCNRPLPSGRVSPRGALVLGLVMSALGVGWALVLQPLYAMIVFAGLFFDLVVYTLWLKRRTPWAIVWGGIAGGMPVLAGRALGLGSLDWISALLALSVLFWIPTHILTFAMCYNADYRRANVPTVASVYGFRIARWVIAASSILAAVCIGVAAFLIGIEWGFVRLLAVLSGGLLLLAAASVFKPAERLNFGLFKYASLYMLSAMVLLML
jgi:protoheme IX farnesyltransferase